MDYINDKTFKAVNFTELALQPTEYEVRHFEACDFSASDLTNFKFITCSFIDCNLSNAKLQHTAFQEVQFTNCKLLGLAFEHCNDFLLSFEFDSCILDHASFYQKKISKTNFTNCQLHEVDFTDTNLSESVFDCCDLNRAIFSNTNLEKVNLQTAHNFSIDPENNYIKQAIFAHDQLQGLLDKYDIRIK